MTLSCKQFFLPLFLGLGLTLNTRLFAEPPRPNIVFVLTDDLGYGDVGVYYQNFRRSQGLPGFHTPHLDQMAADGVRMKRHYASSPVCAPARGSLLTGMHQGHANVRDNEFDKALEDNHTLATLLRDAGYATAAIGKWGVSGDENDGFPGHPLNRGFDFYFGIMHHLDAHFHYPKEFDKRVYENHTLITDDLDKAYSTDLFTARAKHWIQAHHQDQPEQPFFLYLAYTAPHARLEVPTQAYPAGGGENGGVQWTGTPGAVINTASGSIDSWIHPDYASQGWPAHAQRHATMVRRLDDAMGDLFALLNDLKIAEDTLIVFTSDNGPHHEGGQGGGSPAQDPRFFRTYGPLDGIKRDVWEGGIRVPTLVRWANVLPAGRVSTHPSQFHDWLPTFAELAGVPAPFRSDGVSLLNELSGDSPPLPGTVYVEYTTKWYASTPNYADFHDSHRNATRGHMQALYLHGVKGVRYNVQSATDAFRVHEPLNDPQETVNLAGNPDVPAQSDFQNAVLRLRRVHPHDPDGSPARAYDTAAVPAYPLPGAVPGVRVRIFEADLPHVTAFDGLVPAVDTTVQGFDLSDRPRDHDIGFRFTGWLHVPATGDYTFFLNTDTGAVMRLHDILLLDADFSYPGDIEISSGSIRLEAGHHPYRLHTRHAGAGTPHLSLSWSGPGFAKEPVPSENLVLAGPPQAFDVETQTEGTQAVEIPVIAEDAPPEWHVSDFTDPLQGGVNVQGRNLVYTPATGFYGEDHFDYSISNGTETTSARVTVSVIYRDPELLWLPLDEGEGVEIRDAGGGAAGTVMGPNAVWVQGLSGLALELDGTADHIQVVNDYLPPGGATPRTVTSWIRTGGHGSIAAWGQDSPTKKWYVRLESETADQGKLRVEVAGGYRRGNTNLMDGEWHHVAVVLPEGANNTNQLKLYVNGVEDTPYSTVDQEIDTAVTPVEIGKDSHPTPRHFPGRLDEVRIYRRALSAAEIASLAETPDQRDRAWHHRHYGDAPVDWLADDLGDGSTRRERLAMGWNPWSSERPGLLRLIQTGSTPSLTYERRSPDEMPLNFGIEWSTDLSGNQWDPLTFIETVDNLGETGREKVIVPLAPETTPMFYRLKVQRP